MAQGSGGGGNARQEVRTMEATQRILERLIETRERAARVLLDTVIASSLIAIEPHSKSWPQIDDVIMRLQELAGWSEPSVVTVCESLEAAIDAGKPCIPAWREWADDRREMLAGRLPRSVRAAQAAAKRAAKRKAAAAVKAGDA
jgi:hypothetical protein